MNARSIFLLLGNILLFVQLVHGDASATVSRSTPRILQEVELCESALRTFPANKKQKLKNFCPEFADLETCECKNNKKKAIKVVNVKTKKEANKCKCVFQNVKDKEKTNVMIEACPVCSVKDCQNNKDCEGNGKRTLCHPIQEVGGKICVECFNNEQCEKEGEGRICENYKCKNT